MLIFMICLTCKVLKGDEEAATEIDNTVVLHMKRPAYVYNVVSGAVIGEIHAQYSPPERSQYQVRQQYTIYYTSIEVVYIDLLK